MVCVGGEGGEGVRIIEGSTLWEAREKGWISANKGERKGSVVEGMD